MNSGDTSVLIIEDETIVAEIYGLALERSSYRVLKAHDGADGLRIASEALPDFIFLDIRMPKMSGVEVLRGLAENATTRDIPVVMLSNFDDPALVKECMGLGAKEYLVKAGLNPTELPDVVARWLKPPAA